MDYIFFMCIGQSLGDISADSVLLFIIELMLLEVGGEGAPRTVLYDNVVLFIVDNVAVVEARDVRVLQQFQVVYFSHNLLE